MSSDNNNDKSECVEKISFLFDVIRRYDTYIISTNVKASLIIAFNSLVIGGVLLKFGDVIGFYASQNLKLFIGLLLGTIAASTLMSLVFVFQVIYPFFGANGDNKAQEKSLVYFGSVSGVEKDEYIERISKVSLEELEVDLSIQAHILAGGLKGKMNLMRNSIGAIMFTLLSIFLLVIFRIIEIGL